MKQTFSHWKTVMMTAIALVIVYSPISAQITINLPKFPKIKKEKTQPSPSPSTAADSRPAAAAASSTTPDAVREPVETKNDCSGGAIGVHLEDLGKTRKEAEEFTPGSRNYFVSTLSDRKNIYLEAALLPKVRAEWLEDWGPEFNHCLVPALDGLAAAARKTIGGYHGPAGYTLGTPAEKKALTTAIDDIAEGRVLRSGIKQANWLIEKNSYGLPTARYKHGYLLVNYPKSAHGFCWVFWVNLVQDYAGGGTYGASYGNYIGRDVAGCPKS